MEDSRQSTRKEKSENTRKNLINAGYRLFRKEGIDAVGVREIAAEAQVTTGAFYHHFSGKLEILDGIYQQRDSDFREILENQLQGSTELEKILDFFENHMIPQVTEDGRDFTRHRLLQMQKHSGKESGLVSGIHAHIVNAQKNGELTDHVSSEDITEYILLVFRGTLYEWSAIGGIEDVGSAILRNLRWAFAAFTAA